LQVQVERLDQFQQPVDLAAFGCRPVHDATRALLERLHLR